MKLYQVTWTKPIQSYLVSSSYGSVVNCGQGFTGTTGTYDAGFRTKYFSSMNKAQFFKGKLDAAASLLELNIGSQIVEVDLDVE